MLSLGVYPHSQLLQYVLSIVILNPLAMKKIVLLHLCVILGSILFPFFNILLPYIYWKHYQEKEEYTFSLQACNILNFQLVFTLLMIIGIIYGWFRIIVGLSQGEMVNYFFLLYWGLGIVLVNIIYPLFIVVRMKITGKISKYYPDLLPVFHCKGK